MLQKSNLSTALPACGVALSLASFGAACKAEATYNNPETLPKPAAVEKAPDLSGHTFYRFTDIDFRKIMNVPIYEAATTEAAVAKAPASRIQAAISELRQAKNTDTTEHESGGGLGLAAVAPLIGAAGKKGSGQQGGFFKRLFSGGASGPDPEKPGKEPQADRKTTGSGWASRSVEPEPEKHGIFNKISRMWKIWEKPCDLLPSPWNSVVKWGVPIAAATCGVVWFQTIVQVGILTGQMFGGMIEPLAGAAGFLAPMVAAKPIMKGIEKLFHLEPTTGWKREAILKPIQGALLAGAAVWIHSVGLAPITYGIWAAAAVGTGYLVTKIFKDTKAATWTAVGAAIVLPWTHIATQRTFDVTVLSAGPDPEVGAWNITTDLSKMDHWKSVAFFGKQAPPSGQSGMVFLNRDVPLYVPPHREANEFNGHFANLVGKKVQITTIGAWLKPLSPKLQPTIVGYKVLDPSTNASSAAEPSHSK